VCQGGGRSRTVAGVGLDVATLTSMLTIISSFCSSRSSLAAAGYSRWGLGGMSPALLLGIVLLVLLFTRRL
jgi:hypothetical protein